MGPRDRIESRDAAANPTGTWSTLSAVSTAALTYLRHCGMVKSAPCSCEIWFHWPAHSLERSPSHRKRFY